jgi:predicted Zn-dependent protease
LPFSRWLIVLPLLANIRVPSFPIWSLASPIFLGSAHSQTNSSSASFAVLSKRAAEARDANRLEEATKLYRHALTLRPNWEEGWWSLGTLEYDQDHYPQAAMNFQKVISLNSSNGTAHAMLGLCQFELGKDESALKNLLTAERLGVVNNEDLRKVAVYHLGVLQLRKKLYASALKTFRELARNDVRTDEVALGLAMSLLMVQSSDVPAENTVGHAAMLGIGKAEILSTLRKAEEARQMYSSLLQQYPDYPGLHFAYGLLLSADEPEEAIKQMQAELRINPKHVVALLQIAALLMDEDPPRAVEYAKKALAINPRPPFGHFLLGQCYLKTGNAVAALPELELARRNMQNESQIYFALGNAYTKLGRKQEAAHARAEFLRLRKTGTSLPDADQYGQ